MRSRTIALMILHEALRRGLIGFVFGKIAATLWTPEYILFLPDDAGLGLIAVMVVCAPRRGHRAEHWKGDAWR